ncbi:MAG: hypothetical protein O3A63_17915 [Proteobacteria bacterium]|nr:hypothetical protein [Pseudomonadota bacterium]
MTSLVEQLERQRLWKLKADQFQERVSDLVQLEFEDPAIKAQRHHDRLKNFLTYTFNRVPHYRRLLDEHDELGGVDAVLANLHLFPELTKADLRDHAAHLRATTLPDGHRITGATQSSGTTGKPSQVLQTQMDGITFALNKQRECRWFDMHPSGKFAVIRLPRQIGRVKGRAIAVGETLR